jgi:hypothetical protein
MASSDTATIHMFVTEERDWNALHSFADNALANVSASVTFLPNTCATGIPFATRACPRFHATLPVPAMVIPVKGYSLTIRRFDS